LNIFISIASYRDPELQWTIKSAIDNATNPENLFFGVVYQGLESEMPDLSYVKNLSVIKIHPKEARGAGYARSRAMELYSDENYFLQIDSHTRFAQGWDLIAIDQ
jgi:glycosyltransferase involved in cell wall biosynthesis